MALFASMWTVCAAALLARRAAAGALPQPSEVPTESRRAYAKVPVGIYMQTHGQIAVDRALNAAACSMEAYCARDGRLVLTGITAAWESDDRLRTAATFVHATIGEAQCDKAETSSAACPPMTRGGTRMECAIVHKFSYYWKEGTRMGHNHRYTVHRCHMLDDQWAANKPIVGYVLLVPNDQDKVKAELEAALRKVSGADTGAIRY